MNTNTNGMQLQLFKDIIPPSTTNSDTLITTTACASKQNLIPDDNFNSCVATYPFD